MLRQLPDDVLQKIISFLPLRDRIKLMTVSKASLFLNADNVWSKNLQLDFGVYLSTDKNIHPHTYKSYYEILHLEKLKLHHFILISQLALNFVNDYHQFDFSLRVFIDQKISNKILSFIENNLYFKIDENKLHTIVNEVIKSLDDNHAECPIEFIKEQGERLSLLINQEFIRIMHTKDSFDSNNFLHTTFMLVAKEKDIQSLATFYELAKTKNANESFDNDVHCILEQSPYLRHYIFVMLSSFSEPDNKKYSIESPVIDSLPAQLMSDNPSLYFTKLRENLIILTSIIMHLAKVDADNLLKLIITKHSALVDCDFSQTNFSSLLNVSITMAKPHLVQYLIEEGAVINRNKGSVVQNWPFTRCECDFNPDAYIMSPMFLALSMLQDILSNQVVVNTTQINDLEEIIQLLIDAGANLHQPCRVDEIDCTVMDESKLETPLQKCHWILDDCQSNPDATNADRVLKIVQRLINIAQTQTHCGNIGQVESNATRLLTIERLFKEGKAQEKNTSPHHGM